jgi:adhesin/invasin
LTLPVVDHADGTYTTTFTAGTVSGTAIITGTLNGAVIGDSAFVPLRPLPVHPQTTTITADSAALDADDESSTLVTVRVLDEHGNPVGTGGAAVTLVTSLGTLTVPVVDHDNGTYTATLTAGIITGTAAITGTLNGEVIGDTAFVDLRPLDPDPTTTTITADSASIAADGVSRTLITVRVLDEHGNSVGASAGLVTLALNAPLGMLSPLIDHNDGTYSAIFTAGTTAGIAEITGTLNGAVIGDSALVTLRPLPPSARTTTITADSAALDADGVSSTLVTVRVLDQHGNPIGMSAGEVTLATTLGILTERVDHADGTYTATLTAGTVIGTAIISGTLNGEAIGDSAFVTLRPLPPHAQTTTITADSTELDADGESSTLVTVRVLDEHGNPVGASAGDVDLFSSLGNLTEPVDHGDGTYTATLTAGMNVGTAVVSGTLNGEVIGDTAFVDLRPLDPDLTTTTITADSASIAADGVSATSVTVRVRDINGNLIGRSAGDVVLISSLGNLTEAVDHGDGTYTATLTGTTSGTAAITGTLNGEMIGDTAFVDLRPLDPDPTTTTITTDSASIFANGVSATTVTVRVLDANGNPVGRSVGTVTLFTTQPNSLLSAVVDQGDGTYTATLRAKLTVLDTAIVAGRLNGVMIADSARVELRPFTLTGASLVVPGRLNEMRLGGEVLLDGGKPLGDAAETLPHVIAEAINVHRQMMHGVFQGVHAARQTG